MTPELAKTAMKVACVIACDPPYRFLARSLARAVLAGDMHGTSYWLRLAHGVGAAPEPLTARALQLASRSGSAARAA